MCAEFHIACVRTELAQLPTPHESLSRPAVYQEFSTCDLRPVTVHNASLYSLLHLQANYV